MSDDEIIVKAQRMFPNCEKYKKCCTKDKDFWDKMSGQPIVRPTVTEIKNEMILHNVNGYKIDTKRDKLGEKPDGFDGW